MAKKTGWKPIPLSLKTLFVIFILWAIGTVFAIPMRYESGIPFFGLWLSGIVAAVIVLLLDIVGPFTFLYALWNRKSWGPSIAYVYISIFILNSVVAIFTVREQLGLMSILMPALFNAVFLLVIYMKRDYFK